MYYFFLQNHIESFSPHTTRFQYYFQNSINRSSSCFNFLCCYYHTNIDNNTNTIITFFFSSIVSDENQEASNVQIFRKKNSEKKFECDTCKKLYKIKGSLARHITHECNKFRRFDCPRCDRKYLRRDTMLRHLRYECQTDLRFFCEHCKYGARRKAHLSHHLQTRHAFGVIERQSQVKFKKNNGHFSCWKCGNTYMRQATMNRHARYECGQGPRFFCDLCDYCCKRNSQLKQHVRAKHNRTKFVNDAKGTSEKELKEFCQCTKCLKVFSTKRGLNYHLTNVKCKDPVFACNYCDFYTKTSQHELDEHVKTHEDDEKINDVARVEVTEHCCEDCGKVCKTQRGYLIHKKSCCKGITYSCPQCDFSSKLKIELKKHMKIHEKDEIRQENNNSFDESMMENTIEINKCPKCDMNFGNEMDLEIHATVCEDETGNGMMDQSLAADDSNNARDTKESVEKQNEVCTCVTCGKQFVTIQDFQIHDCGESSRNDFSLKLNSTLETSSAAETSKNEIVKSAKKSGSCKRRKITMVKPVSESSRDSNSILHCEQCDYSAKSKSHYHKHVALKHNIRNVYERDIQN